MSAAGQSAGDEARRLHALSTEYARRAAEAHAMAENWMIGHNTERQVAASLAPLSAAGYTILHDRGWPGSKQANIDHVVVGPGGLFVVDTKSWAEVTIAGGRIFRGQADVTDDVNRLADVAYGTQAAMAELGLPANEVRAVVVLANSSLPAVEVGSVTVVGEKLAAKHINSCGGRLLPAQVDLVLAAAMQHFPARGETLSIIDASIPTPAMPEPEPEPLLTVDEVAEVLLAGLMAAPIEEWMSFLHPDQARLVRRNFSGPSRIRGAAGTGKTVVGLHRAAYLARSTAGMVLVTSFVKTLPKVLSNLLLRLAPETAGRVEFLGVHGFALDLLKTRGIRPNVKRAETDLVFTSVWRQHGLGTVLAKVDPNQNYWRDEISKVIKGRGLTIFEQYAGLARTGRRRALGVDQRRAVWQLFMAYENGLRERGIHDFDDVILMAEASLRATPLTTYGAVIIDEAQDLTCAMVRMLYLLVGDVPDGLTLIGDGQQSIYPGGFTLAEAGIAVTGRGVVMTTNYRNTREIVEFARSQVAGDEFTDIEGALQEGDRVTDIPRSGSAPTTTVFSSRRAHDDALVSWVRGLDTPLADIGVLSLNTYGVRDATAALVAAGIPVINLKDYTGKPVQAVKVGTVKRSKGLEFKQVVLARVPPVLLDGASEGDEARSLQRREMYVAMTRARDGLWVGGCS